MKFFLIITILALLGLVLYFAKVYNKINNAKTTSNLYVNSTSFLQNKVDCDVVDTKCTADSDCKNMCSFGLSCVNGLCKSRYNNLQQCDAKQGYVSIYTYDVVTNSYTNKCLSVDPGITVPKAGESNFCIGGTTVVDYTKNYPKSCFCPNGNILPIWGNLNRRQSYGCTNSQIYKQTYVKNRIDDVL